MTPTYSTDIVIFGGGIAGLWLLNRLRNQGFDAILFESNQIGSGQTIASQGIIHGGLKYALNGALTGATEAIADMPSRWRNCLAGSGDVDLQGTAILSNHYYLWSASGIRSKLKTFLGSKSLRGKVNPLQNKEFSSLFRNSTVQGNLYELPDFVINTDSLLQVLARNQFDHLFKYEKDAIEFNRNQLGNIESVSIISNLPNSTSSEIQIEAQQFIFCAGGGNEKLISQANLKTPNTQRRPLKMVWIRNNDLPPAYVHCIGDSFSLTPRLTVTTHYNDENDVVWYLGGELAEKGVERSNEEQIQAAKNQTAESFPWVDFSNASWNCISIDRCEAKIENRFRPDDTCLIAEDNAIAVWPTKLTLTPSLADKIVEHLANNSIAARPTNDHSTLRQYFGEPKIAVPYWN